MKNSILLSLSFFLFAISATAQDRVREAGITFRNLDSFGLTYKTGTDSKLWRFKSAMLSANFSDEQLEGASKIKNNSFDIVIAAGREYRQLLSDNFQFRYGFDVKLGYDSRRATNPGSDYKLEATTFKPGINAVIGFNYVVKDKLVFGVETLPGISYETGKEKTKQASLTTESDISGLTYELSSWRATLSVAYRF